MLQAAEGFFRAVFHLRDMHFFEAVGAVQPWGSGVGTTGSWRMFAIAAMIMDAAVKP
jgi:hypothetical protein